MKNSQVLLASAFMMANVAHAQIQPVAIPYLHVRTAADTYVPLTADRAAALPKIVTSQPCVRYNNFWCLKGTHWDGEISAGEQHLAVFSSPVYAARAFAIVITKYYTAYKLKTPHAILSRFILSPACATDRTSAICQDMWARVSQYSASLSDAMGIAADDDCALLRADGSLNAARARLLFRAIAHQESGTTLQINDALIDAGVKAAGMVMR